MSLRTAGRALYRRSAFAPAIQTGVRRRTTVIIATRVRIIRVHARPAHTLHGIRTHIVIFRARMRRVTGRTGLSRIQAMARHRTISFPLRAACIALNRCSADTRPVRTLIRRRTTVIITARVRIIRVHTRTVHALHRIRTHIIIFRTIPGLDALRTRFPRIQAMTRQSAVRVIRRTASCALYRSAALTRTVRALIPRRTTVIVTAGIRIRRIHAFAVRALHGIRTHIAVFFTRMCCITRRTRARILAMPRQPAIGFV